MRINVNDLSMGLLETKRAIKFELPDANYKFACLLLKSNSKTIGECKSYETLMVNNIPNLVKNGLLIRIVLNKQNALI